MLLKNKLKGFSLAEMMVVMLILSIVLAAAMPIITHRVVAGQSVSNDSIPSGLIAIWKGSSTTIPEGWHLCDGTNGTPDLRSRFVYGAGGDINTKSSLVSGWDTTATGHWAIGYTGGEEVHILATTEMPYHNHSAWTDAQGQHAHSFSLNRAWGQSSWPDAYGFGYGRYDMINATQYASNTLYTNEAGAHGHNVGVGYNGSNSPHNTLPRFYCLAYIMKL